MLAGVVLVPFLLTEVARLICWRMNVSVGGESVGLIIILGVLIGIAVGVLAAREPDDDE